MVSSTLHRRIAADFERGDVVEVDGWVLSLTEVRLAALAHVVRGPFPRYDWAFSLAGARPSLQSSSKASL